MRSKKADFKKEQIQNWNRQQSPRVRPVADQIERIKGERKLEQAREGIEYRRNTRERERLIREGLIRPREEK